VVDMDLAFVCANTFAKRKKENKEDKRDFGSML
jgi:hypothetical protein